MTNRDAFEATFANMVRNFRAYLTCVYRMTLYQCSITRIYINPENEQDTINIPYMPGSFFELQCYDKMKAPLNKFWPENGLNRLSEGTAGASKIPSWMMPKGLGIILAGDFGCGKSYYVYHLADKYSARVIDFDGSRKSRWPQLEKEAVESRTKKVICTFDEFDKLVFSDVETPSQGDGKEGSDENTNESDASAATQNSNFPVGSALTMLDRILMNPNCLVVMLVNNISKIHPGFLRPGRVGSHIVYVSHLTKEDVKKIMLDWCNNFPARSLAAIDAEF